MPEMRQTAQSSPRPHLRQLEQARAQVIELLSRQAVEKELLSRSENRRQDVVAHLVERQHQTALEQRLRRLHPADIAFVLESLSPDARDLAWSLVRGDRRGAVLLETADAVRRALIRHMPVDEIAALVKPLDSEDIADLIGSLPEEQGQAVLQRLDRDDQDEVRSMLSFPEGSVGAMMDLDAITVREDASLESVLQLVRRRKDLPAHTNQLFVVDRDNVLRGLLPLTKLLVGAPEAVVGQLMNSQPVYFYTDDRMRDAIDAFEKYDLLSAPVVNLHDQIVGRLTVDAVLDEVNERAQIESLRQVGLSPDEDVFAPTFVSARNRWPWLGLNLLTAFLASRVVGWFEPIIAQLVALAALMPIVASIGGNTGNQTAALVNRALALNQLNRATLRPLLFKELGIATINGLLWGSVLALATQAIYRQWPLSFVIAGAVLLNLWLAALAGVAIPLALQRFGRDPIMGASVILTGLTDSGGFFIFLGLAALFLV
jgi:magnesium transporter